MKLRSLHKNVKQDIEKDYNVLAYIDLLDYYSSSNFDQLAEDLRQLKKEKFNDNDLIVLTHFDVEYFIDKVGLLFYNLIYIMKKIDFPSFFVAIFTNHYKLETQIDYICSKIFFTDNSFKIFYTPCQTLLWDNEQVKKINLNVQDVDFKFSSLSRMHRTHRKVLSGFLKENVDIKNNLFAFSLTENIEENNLFAFRDSNNLKIRDKDFHYIVDTKGVMLNETYVLSEKNHFYYKNFSEFKNPLIDTRANSYNTRYQYKILQKSFLDIVSETVFDYPYAFITEKTFRPITNKRPFVLFGAPGTLAFLKDLGFKTFSDWINESYDQTVCPNKRLDLIFNEITKINTLSIDSLRRMLQDMESIIEHNFENYHGLDKKILAASLQKS